MIELRQPDGMHPITDNEIAQPTDIDEREETAAHLEPLVSEGPVPVEDIEKLVVRIAGSDDADSIEDLTQRAGGARLPNGALMLAALDGRVLAAASMARRES